MFPSDCLDLCPFIRHHGQDFYYSISRSTLTRTFTFGSTKLVYGQLTPLELGLMLPGSLSFNELMGFKRQTFRTRVYSHNHYTRGSRFPRNEYLPCSKVLRQEAELQLELLHQRDGEVHGAPALAAFHRLEVVIVALAASVVKHVAGAVRGLKVVPRIGKCALDRFYKCIKLQIRLVGKWWQQICAPYKMI